MLFWLFSKLFDDEIMGRYVGKPQHTLFALFIMTVGFVTMVRDNWFIFGITTFILGVLLFLAIVVNIGWQPIIEYWQTINEHIKMMNKINNPDLWYALGYKQVPQSVTIEEREDTGQGFYNTHIRNIPISPASMSMIANKVLTSGNVKFSETDYAKLIPKFRKVREDWRENKGYIKYINKDNPNLGHKWTKKGIDMLYEFKSIGIELKIKGEE
jgi:hypothetical protein